MTGAEQSALRSVRAQEAADKPPRDPRVRNNAPVPLEPELEHQVLAIAAHTGHSRAEVIQEMVRDRLKGGTFGSPFPFPVKHPADSQGALAAGRHDTDPPSTQRTA